MNAVQAILLAVSAAMFVYLNTSSTSRCSSWGRSESA
jgi:hypothetical protein